MVLGRHPEEQRQGRSESGIAAFGAHRINWKNPKDGDLQAFVQDQVHAHDARHYDWMRRAKVQLAWAAGEQLKIWDDTARDLAPSYDVQADRIALFVNRLKPAILNWVSLVTARPITFRVAPATPENVDVASASVQDKLARYYWRHLLGDATFLDALWLMFCTGCSFIQSGWDPSAGSQYRLGAADLMSQEEMEQSKATTGIRGAFGRLLSDTLGLGGDDEYELGEEAEIPMNMGDLHAKVLSGFEIINPPKAYSIETAPWLIVRDTENLEDLRYRYGKKADRLRGGDTSEDPLVDGFGLMEGSYFRNQRGIQDSDTIRTYKLYRPGLPYLPKGYYCKLAQGVVLEKGPNPYEHGEIPVVQLREIPAPKQFWPPSTVTDLMSLQSEMNITHSQLAEHKASTIDPRIIAEKGVGLHEDAFAVRNEIVWVNAGKIDRVRPWIPEPLPPWIPKWAEMLNAAFDDVSRAHKPSYGKQGGVRSGKQAIAYQEADARLNMPMLKLLRESLAHVCRQWMAILHQNADEERVSQITGENNEIEIVTWSKADFPYAEFNVECDLGPAVDQNTLQELIDMLTARGWLTPQKEEDRNLVFRWLGMGVAHEVDDGRVDRRNAATENQILISGRPTPVSGGDNHAVHIDEHSREQKSGRYREAVASNPQIEQLFEEHKIDHVRKAIMAQLRPQLQAALLQAQLAQEYGMQPPQPDNGQPPSNGKPASQNGQAAGGTHVPEQPKNNVQPMRPNRASRRGTLMRSPSA